MKYKSIICTIILIMVLSISVGFSAFVSEMSISKIVADVRVEKDVRITSVEYIGGENVIINDINYDTDSIVFNNGFSSLDGYVEFSVTITNISSAEVGIFDIKMPDGIAYDISHNIGNKLCDAEGKCNLGSSTVIKFLIYPYDEEGLNGEYINVDFDFRQFYDVVYKNILLDNHEIIGGDEIILRFGDKIPATSEFVIYENDILLVEGKDYEVYSNYLWIFGVEGDLIIEAVYKYTYDYIGDVQTFVAPLSGTYKIELWGASSGNNGGYVSGDIQLNKNDSLYIYVGQRGVNDMTNPVIFNGGGGATVNGDHIGDSGSGATDVRLVSGAWDNFDSLKSRIMVAGGGSSGGAGGGLIGGGLDSSLWEYPYVGHGGTQTSGGAEPLVFSDSIPNNQGGAGGFGYGGRGGASNTVSGGSGGGGGYYGGSGSSGCNGGWWPGAGGSSFISGHNGCDAIASSSTAANIVHTGQSVHYSGYKFFNTVMVGGDGYNWTSVKGDYVGMPTHDGTGTMVGNAGGGYAKIRLIG